MKYGFAKRGIQALALAFGFVLTSCGGGGGVASIFLTPSLATAFFDTLYNAPIQLVSTVLPPITWSMTGNLPPGINFCTGNTTPTCNLTGTPTSWNASPSAYTFTVTVTDNNTPQKTDSRQYSIKVNPKGGTLSLTSTALPAGTQNIPYANGNIVSSGGLGPFAWQQVSGALPAGINFCTGNITATCTLTGTPTAVGTSSNIVIQVADSNSPAQNAQRTYSITITAQAPNTTVTGNVQYDTGANLNGAQITVKDSTGATVANGPTNSLGNYSIPFAYNSYPTRFLVTATYTGPGLPVVTGSEYSANVTTGGTVNITRIQLANMTGLNLTRVGDTFSSTEIPPKIVITIPNGTNINNIYSKSFDPAANPDAFPGEFVASTGNPLNSSVFLNILARDAAGNPVVTLPSPATVRVQVPSSQWADLTDINTGNGQIDIPIYSYDYTTGQWVPKPDGWLEDVTGTKFPESAAAPMPASFTPSFSPTTSPGGTPITPCPSSGYSMRGWAMSPAMWAVSTAAL